MSHEQKKALIQVIPIINELVSQGGMESLNYCVFRELINDQTKNTNRIRMFTVVVKLWNE